jgi:hypothetical protein
MNILNKILFFLVLVSAAVRLEANPLLPVFADSEMEYTNTSEQQSHTILLSSPKRISNALVIENKRKVIGLKSESLYTVNAGSSIADAFEFYKKQIARLGEVLYECKKRACGSSNYWANNIFDEHRLYGRDSGQYYLAGKIKDKWFTIYIVQNGLRKNLVYLSEISPQATSQDWTNGQLVSAGLLSEEQLGQIKKILSTQATSHLYLAAYSRSDVQSVGALEKTRSDQAEKLKRKIIDQLSIASSRIESKLIGPFHSEVNYNSQEIWFRIFIFEP